MPLLRHKVADGSPEKDDEPPGTVRLGTSQQVFEGVVEVSDEAGDIQRRVLLEKSFSTARECALADIERYVADRSRSGHHRVEQGAGLARVPATELYQLPAAGTCDDLWCLLFEDRKLRAGLVVLGDSRYLLE